MLWHCIASSERGGAIFGLPTILRNACIWGFSFFSQAGVFQLLFADGGRLDGGNNTVCNFGRSYIGLVELVLAKTQKNLPERVSREVFG